MKLNKEVLCVVWFRCPVSGKVRVSIALFRGKLCQLLWRFPTWLTWELLETTRYILLWYILGENWVRDSQDMHSSTKSCILQKLVSSDPYKIYCSPGLLSADPGVLLLLMGELVRKENWFGIKLQASTSESKEIKNCMCSKSARAWKQERVSKLACSLIRYWCMDLLNVSCT